MYYFIIPITKSYHFLCMLHFVKCVLHFKMYYCYKYTNFASGNTKRKRNGLNLNAITCFLYIIYY